MHFSISGCHLGSLLDQKSLFSTGFIRYLSIPGFHLGSLLDKKSAISTGFIRYFDVPGTSCGPHARLRIHCRQRFSMYFAMKTGPFSPSGPVAKQFVGKQFLRVQSGTISTLQKLFHELFFTNNFQSSNSALLKKNCLGSKTIFGVQQFLQSSPSDPFEKR